MAHNGVMTDGNGYKGKDKNKIDRITVEVLDDGTFYYEVYTKGGECRDYSYQSVEGLIKAVKDDVKTPHLRMVEKDKKEDKSELKEESMRKPMGKWIAKKKGKERGEGLLIAFGEEKPRKITKYDFR